MKRLIMTWLTASTPMLSESVVCQITWRRFSASRITGLPDAPLALSKLTRSVYVPFLTLTTSPALAKQLTPAWIVCLAVVVKGVELLLHPLLLEPDVLTQYVADSAGENHQSMAKTVNSILNHMREVSPSKLNEAVEDLLIQVQCLLINEALLDRVSNVLAVPLIPVTE